VVASAAVVAAIGVLAGVGFVVGRDRPAGKPHRPRAAYPAARLADADFATTPALAARGVFQALDAVASYGATVVAAGSQTAAGLGRTQFFASADGGRTWQLAPVTASDGGEQVTSQAPTAIAAGPAGWLALGHGMSWTSATGRSWRVGQRPGLMPTRPGDRLVTLTATASGFLAAGSATQRGGSRAVIWVSFHGLSWRRVDAPQLHLAAPGPVRAIIFAAAHGDNTVIAGQVAKTVVTGTGSRRRTRHTTEVDLWRSPDGGQSWARVLVPVTNGAANAVSGLGPSGAGFVLVRPAVGGKAGRGGVVYISTTGKSWSYRGKITEGKRAYLRPVSVSGSDQGAVIAALVAGGRLVAYQSGSGRSWRRTAVLGRTATDSLSNLTVVAGGNVVAAGASDGRGLLVVAGAGRAVVAGAGRAVVDLTKIRGGSFAQRAVDAIASAPGMNVAVGSANGNPAVWVAPGGHHWSRAVGTSPGVFGRRRVGGLTSVTRGRDGWLAVGGTMAGGMSHPVVVFSHDGLTWSAADGGQPFASANAGAAGAAYGAHGYVIVGARETGGRTAAAAWWAPALTQTTAGAGQSGKRPPLWRQGTDAGKGDLDGKDGPRSMSAVTSGPFGYVAVGQHAGRPAVWTSSDGRAWRLFDLPAAGGGATAGLRYVASSGSRVVALGDIRAVGRTVPLAAFSPDGGKTWREVAVSLPGGVGEVTGLTAVGTGFAAVSAIGPQGRSDVAVLTSADGTAWRPVAASGAGLSGPGAQEITALTTAGGELLGAGFTMTQTTQDATLWLAPAGLSR